MCCFSILNTTFTWNTQNFCQRANRGSSNNQVGEPIVLCCSPLSWWWRWWEWYLPGSGHRTVRVSDRKGTIRSGERPLKRRRMISHMIIDQKEWLINMTISYMTTQNGEDDNKHYHQQQPPADCFQFSSSKMACILSLVNLRSNSCLGLRFDRL